jgi:hypothetical protein
MIRYSLRCEKDHEFEAWFRSGDDYDRMAAKGAVSCAVCGSTTVEKALMAPALGRSTRKKGGEALQPVAASEATGGDERVQLATVDAREQALRSAIRELRRKVVEHADYVGDRFADEARKIHYKESEPRGIYGEATTDEAKALAEEGIDFHPLPSIPEDQN